MTSRLADPCRSSPLAFTRDEEERFIRVVAERRLATGKCCTELYFPVFFDGTNNNLRRDKPRHSQSNVVRLREALPLDDRYFPSYAPGVGTPFPEIGDSGEGYSVVTGDKARGLAFAHLGEARIVWGLIEALNNLHRFYYGGTPLLDPEKTRRLIPRLTAPKPSRGVADILFPATTYIRNLLCRRATIEEARRVELSKLCRELHGKVKAAFHTRAAVKKIRVSVFGFSRGAAQARAFTNWFVEMCREASGDGSVALAGIPVQVDFLGLFDTVASVGLANSALVADGHMEWADSEQALRVNNAVRRCLHLVAAHEVRRSFPLDSIRMGSAYGSHDHEEVVYPGVHPDVGGGYKPAEQGRGVDPHGADMLSRIPLAHMYRAARLAGVPLDVDGPGVAADSKAALRVAPTTIAAFNAYIAAARVRTGTLEDIMREQTELHARWRRMRVDNMELLASVQRSAPQDRTDILAANNELKEEVRLLSREVRPLAVMLPTAEAATGEAMRHALESASKRGVDPRREDDWTRLRPLWVAAEPLPPAQADLFDELIHDSRAWFKPLGEHDEVWVEQQQKRVRALARLEQNHEYWRNKMHPEHRDLPRAQRARLATGVFRPLTDDEEALLNAWRKHGQLPTQTTGREPFWSGGGYLRFRRIYSESALKEHSEAFERVRHYMHALERLEQSHEYWRNRMHPEHRDLPRADRARLATGTFRPLTEEEEALLNKWRALHGSPARTASAEEGAVARAA
jgi:hypothetical protein